MPTYQYVCTNPDEPHEFERVQSFTDDPVSECPVCGSPVRKRYGSVGVVFKGSGFYATDNRSKGKATASASADSGAKDSGSKGDPKPKSDARSSSDKGSSSTPAASTTKD